MSSPEKKIRNIPSKNSNINKNRIFFIKCI